MINFKNYKNEYKNKKVIYYHKILLLTMIWILSFYCLSAKFWSEDEVSYWLYSIEMLRWFSVWATIIALIWSTANLILLLQDNVKNTWLNSYNFKIFTVTYNLMAGIVFWCGLFSFPFKELLPSPVKYPISFSFNIIGHTIIPSLLIIYLLVFSDSFVNKNYYKKDFFYSLIFPALYGAFMLFRSFVWLHIYNIKAIKWDADSIKYISPYWFLSWFIYGWGYWFGGILLFAGITLTINAMFSSFNNLSLFHRKIKVK